MRLGEGVLVGEAGESVLVGEAGERVRGDAVGVGVSQGEGREGN